MTKPWKPWRREGQADYYAAVGYLCAEWNAVERIYSYLASDMMRLNRDKHDLLFRHMGIIAIGSFMQELAVANKKPRESIEQLEHVTKFVNICRINRNAIVHGHSDSDFDPKAIRMMSVPDRSRQRALHFTVSLPDVQRVCDDCSLIAVLALRLQFLFPRLRVGDMQDLFGGSWREKLFAKPPLPKLLAENPPKSPRPKRQPRSSRG